MPPAGPSAAATQGLDRDQLLRLDEPERVARLQDALCQLYLAFTGHGDDEDADGDLDPTEPLILESLVAAQLNAELEGLLGVSVPISTLMLDGLSIAKVSEELSRALQNGSSEETPPAPPGAPKLVPDPASRHLEFPLAEIQQAYWVGRDPVFELGNVSAYLYAEYRAVDFEAPRAERALRRVIARHDMLRSVVGEDGAQRVLPEAPPYHVDVIDLRSEEAGAAQAVLAEAREQMTQRQTRPDQWQPFEVRVFLLDERRAQVHMSIDMVKLDAWSAQLLLAEWFDLYDDPDKDLPEISLTFRDYVAWTRELEASESFERSRRYWLDRVPSLPAAPELPLVKPLAAVTRPRFTTRRARLDRDTWSRLKDRAARDGLTPSMLLCAAYTEVLAAWSSRQRFTLSVSGGRPPVHPQIGQVLGSFAKLMLLEVDATATGGFLTRARALQAQLSRDFEHRHFGGLEVLRELARIHGPTRAGMPVLFTSVLPQGGVGGLSRPRWLVGDPYLEWAMPQLMLENQVLELGGDLIVTWGAVEKLFPEGLLDEMFGAYRRFLERLAYQDDAWTGDRLELLPPAQLARREAVNRTEGPLPEGLLHTPFAERVVEHGDAPAVISARRTLSYAQLDRHATHLARTLRQRGVAPNSLVAVSMEKGWEQVVAVLGVLRSGAAYLPLDPDLPTRRLHYLLANGEVSHVLTQPWVDERLAWPDGVARVQVHEEDGWRAADPRPMEDAQAPTDLAYVIYTSGSTGQPKGVAIDHRSALNTILDVNRRFDVGPGDRVLALSALSFDLSVYDVFGPLAAGGAIVIPDPDGLKDPAHWTELLQREKVTVWNSAPALMEMLAEHPEARGDSLRLALLSGDWIPTSLPERIWRTFPDTAVISLGGATEASIWSIFHPVGEQDCRRRSIPYGRPLTNQRFHVLNQRLEPCPDLAPGEIYIAGAGLAQCYWRDEERTKASFLTHPHTGEPLYRTGDLGRYLPGGEIEFLGRDDSQVKVNGYRIELGEVEAALAEHPAVRSAVAVAHGQREESKSLAAYVLVDEAARTGSAGEVAAADNGGGFVADLRGFLAERLPGHAVPAQIVEVEELPLTANGKLDRSALTRPAESAASRRRRRVPRTPAEAQLVELWGKLLEAPKVGVDDNFFELGGTSLLAVRLAIRAQEAGLALSTADVLRHPTVAELAALASGRTELPTEEVLGSCAAVPAETRPEANGERR